jgi:hypothetical protein
LDALPGLRMSILESAQERSNGVDCGWNASIQNG